MSKTPKPFKRPHVATLAKRLAEPRRFMQVVAGPHRTLMVGGDGVRLEEFLAQPVEHWIGP